MIRIRTRLLRMKSSLTAAVIASWLLIAPMALKDRGGIYSANSPHSATAYADSASVSAMPRIAIDGGDVMDPPALDNAHAAGVSIFRMTVAWSDIEPANTDPSHYSWTSTDNRLQAVASRGLSPLVIITGCPAWACQTINGPLYDNMGSEVAQFVGAMAGRYRQSQYNAHYWELWNEPDDTSGSDHQLYWGMHPDKYAQMLASVYPAIKAADPNSVVMSGGLAFDNWFSQGGSFNPDFLNGLLNNNGASYLDALAFHYYKNNNNGWTNIGLKAAQIHNLMSTHGVNLPLICTESGLTSSTNFDSSEPIQASYVVQMNAQAAANGVQAISWYLNRDFPARIPGWEVFSMSGLTRQDNTHKPAFTAMQVFAQEIGSGQFLRQLGASDGVAGSLEGYRFRGTYGNRQTSVVWNNSNGQATLTIPAAQASELDSVVNLYGQAVSAQAGSNGTLLVNVSSDPVYVRWGGSRFTDVPSTAWMYSYVEYLASRGIIGGYSDGSFHPNDPATRGQFSKMVVLGKGWPINTAGGPHFVDVPQSNAFYSLIETAYGRGIISGYTCGGKDEPCPGTYFRPSTDITRAQITKLIVLSKGWTLLNPSRPSFNDLPSDSAFYSFIETAVSHQVVSGYSDGTFHPNDEATRGQRSKMLSLALQQP